MWLRHSCIISTKKLSQEFSNHLKLRDSLKENNNTPTNK